MAYTSVGQTLVVTTGVGLVQRWGEPVQEIRAGDVVWFRPEKSVGMVFLLP